MSLIRLGEILRITNIKIKDEGTYECATSNQFQSDYSIFKLTIFGMFIKHNYFRNRQSLLYFKILSLFIQ